MLGRVLPRAGELVGFGDESLEVVRLVVGEVVISDVGPHLVMGAQFTTETKMTTLALLLLLSLLPTFLASSTACGAQLSLSLCLLAPRCVWNGSCVKIASRTKRRRKTKSPSPPTAFPSKRTKSPSSFPTPALPTEFPSKRTKYPSSYPTVFPSKRTKFPSPYPTRRTKFPSRYPTRRTRSPSSFPTRALPTLFPSRATKRPSSFPTPRQPSLFPTKRDRSIPTVYPSSPTPGTKPRSATPTYSVPEVKLRGSTTTAQSAQGISVALSDEYIVTGGSWDDDKRGSAWVFDASSGAELQRLQPGKIALGSQFGTSVAIFDQTIVVGAPYDANQLGAAVVFELQQGGKGKWKFREKLKLVHFDPLSGPVLQFGYSLALSPLHLLVGAPGLNYARGTAYVFSRTGTFRAKLEPNDGEWFSQAGLSVALNDASDVAILGGPGDARYNGAAWVFVRHGEEWSQAQAKLKVNPPGQFFMGVSVSMNSAGTRALIGSSWLNGKRGGGLVYEVRADGKWVRTYTLFARNFRIVPEQGYSVALNAAGDRAVLGAPKDDVTSGAAFVFAFDSKTKQWREVERLVASGVYRAQQGYAVAIRGTHDVVVGGPYDVGVAGAAWWFRI